MGWALAHRQRSVASSPFFDFVAYALDPVICFLSFIDAILERTSDSDSDFDSEVYLVVLYVELCWEGDAGDNDGSVAW